MSEPNAMTEEQAATRWCPMVRMHAGYSVESRGFYAETDNRAGRCIGSACAMWRWNETRPAGYHPHDGPFTEAVADTGYCGLAGAVR